MARDGGRTARVFWTALRANAASGIRTDRSGEFTCRPPQRARPTRAAACAWPGRGLAARSPLSPAVSLVTAGSARRPCRISGECGMAAAKGPRSSWPASCRRAIGRGHPRRPRRRPPARRQRGAQEVAFYARSCHVISSGRLLACADSVRARSSRRQSAHHAEHAAVALRRLGRQAEVRTLRR